MKPDIHTPIKLNGSFYINNDLITDNVTVGFSDKSISLMDKYPSTIKRIGFSPFGKNSFLNGVFTKEQKQQGFYYELSGTWLGGYNHGPLGHPGDNENRWYSLRKVRIDIKYIEEGIKVLISGATEKGRDENGYENILPPVSFKADFLIPANKAKEIFEMDDQFYKNFIKNNFPAYA